MATHAVGPARGARVDLFGGPPVKLSWGAILGGTFVALGVWVLLYSLGLALGLSSVDPNDPGSAKAAGIGTGVWSLIAPLIALFVGGAVASRTAGVVDKAGGAIHGAVLWGLTTLAGVVLLGFALSNLLGGALSLGKGAVGAVGSAAGAAVGAADRSNAGDALARNLGLNFDDALAPVNQRLRNNGKPAVTPEQLQAASADVLNDSLRTGRLDREQLVSSLADKTSLSRRDAEDLALRMEQQWNEKRAQAGQKVEEVKQDVQQGALKAADTTGKAFWGVFGALFLGLVSAVLGATLGVTRRQRLQAEGSVREVVGAPRREVYP